MKTNKKAVLASIILFFLTGNETNVFSQNQWQRIIGGSASDYAYSIIKTTDDGYAVVGSTRSFGAGGSEFYIVKLDASGMLQWSRTAGGTGNDYGYSITQTTDGGYIVFGSTESFGAGSRDLLFVKLNASGVLQWSRTAGGTGNDYGYSIIQTNDGGYAGAGSTHSFGAGGGDFYLVKLDASGSLQWSRTIGGIAWDAAFSIIQTTDGSYVAAGWAVSFGFGFYIVKLDANGTLKWNKSIGVLEYPGKVSAIQTSDGGYALAGHTEGEENIYIVKLDGGGNLQWSRTVGGTSFDGSYSIIQTYDGGYAAAGYTASFGEGLLDFYIVKLDGNGILQWSRTIGSTGMDYAFSIIQAADGGYVVAGFTNSFGGGDTACYIAKLDANGNTCSNFSSPLSTSGVWDLSTSKTPTILTQNSAVTTIIPTSVIGGTVTPVCLVGVQAVTNEVPDRYRLFQNYPNPFNPSTNIKYQIANTQLNNGIVELAVYNVLGEKIAILVDQEQIAGTYEVDWNASNYSSGVYYYKLTVRKAGSWTRDYVETKKMLMIK